MLSYVFLTLHLTVILVLFCAAISDMETRLVSNKYTYAILALATVKLVLYAVHGLWLDFAVCIIGGVVIFLATVLSSLLSHGSGGADVKVTSALGLCLGLANTFLITVLAFLFATVYLLYRKKHHQISMKTSIPYLPFLFIGTVFCWNLL